MKGFADTRRAGGRVITPFTATYLVPISSWTSPQRVALPPPPCSKCIMVVNVSPATENVPETKCSLEFASRARKVWTEGGLKLYRMVWT